MIHARDFVDAGRERGFVTYAGVPCSFLTPFINFVIGAPGLNYVSAANEGDAVAMAAGAWLGGRRGIAMMQNSGLGVSVNALASLTTMYAIPTLLVISWRGEGGNDAPEHILMGEIMLPILDLLKIEHRVVTTKEPMASQIAWAKETMLAKKYPVALIVPGGVLE